MIHKYLIRYVILVLALLLCAGVAWYLTNATGDPHGDVVLVYSENPVINGMDAINVYLEREPGDRIWTCFKMEEKEAGVL